MYPKDTEKWKQFTTHFHIWKIVKMLFCIPKILKNESNSQLVSSRVLRRESCFVSQRYWKMKAIHNHLDHPYQQVYVVLYPKDTEKWKQFTTYCHTSNYDKGLFCIPKILKNESNSQLYNTRYFKINSCFVSQRYWKMKAIHNSVHYNTLKVIVVLYPKDTEKWKQFTTLAHH